MTPSQRFFGVLTPGLLLMFLFFGAWVFVLILIPLVVFRKLRDVDAPWWQATFLAAVTLYLLSWAILSL